MHCVFLSCETFRTSENRICFYERNKCTDVLTRWPLRQGSSTFLPPTSGPLNATWSWKQMINLVTTVGWGFQLNMKAAVEFPFPLDCVRPWKNEYTMQRNPTFRPVQVLVYFLKGINRQTPNNLTAWIQVERCWTRSCRSPYWLTHLQISTSFTQYKLLD